MEVVLEDFKETVLVNQTVTSSGNSAVFNGFGAKQIVLFINVSGTVTGTTPTIQFTIKEIDPGDGATATGVSATGVQIVATGVQIIELPVTRSSYIQVTWTVTGTTPVFNGVYATLINKVAGTSVLYDNLGNQVFGSAGSPGTAVLTVQGVSGGAPMATAASPGTDRTASGTIAALNALVAINTQGGGDLGVTITGTWSATLSFQGTIDGTNWFSVGALPLPVVSTSLTAFAAFGNGQWTIPCAGLAQVRVTATAYTSGTATVTFEGNPSSSTVTGIVTVANPTATYATSVLNLTSGASTAALAMTGFSAALATVYPGFTVSATLVFEYAGSDGNFLTANILNLATGAVTSSLVLAGLQSTAAYAILVPPGAFEAHVRVSSYTSGSGFVYLTATNANPFVRITDGSHIMPMMDAVARPGYQALTDGTNGPAAVKAASTAATAADPALVVAISPNANSTVPGSITSGASSVTLPLGLFSGAAFNIASGTLSATLFVEVSMDGSSYQPTGVWAVLGANLTYGGGGTLSFTNPNAGATYVIETPPGAQSVRVAVFSYTSGSANVVLTASNAVVPLITSTVPGQNIPPSATMVGGSDGTSLRAIATDNTGQTKVVQATAANLNATATQGSPNTLANKWPVQVTDGTNTMPTMDVAARAAFQKVTDGTNTAAVKPASTAAVATDPALVVAISPNNSFSITAADASNTGALGAANAAVSVTHPGLQSIGMQLAAGTLIGTIVPEVSFDGGTTWNATYFDDPVAGNITSSLVFGSSNTATAKTIVGVGGAGQTRVRVSAYTSGTANVTVRASDISDPALLSGGGPGAALPPVVQQVGGSDGANLRALLTDVGGRQLVKVTDGTNFLPTMDVAARAAFQKITDGTSTAAVKAASTAAVAADPALVVAISPNNTVTPTLVPDRTATGTITALNALVAISTQGVGNVGLTLTGVWSATLTFQGTIDGTNWFAVQAMPLPVTASSTTASTTTVNAQFTVPTSGLSQFRVTATAFTSGTATVTLEGNQGAATHTGIHTVQQGTAANLNASVRNQDSAGTGINSLADAGGMNGLAVALGPTNYPLSSNNSSTVQLAAGATFTGVIETIYNEQAISLLLTSDQPGTITLNQWIDAGGTRLAQTNSYYVSANTGFSRSVVANGNYFNLTFKNTGSATTTTLNINTAYGILQSQTNLGNLPVAINEINGVSLGTIGRVPVSLADPGVTDIFDHIVTANRISQIQVPFYSGTPASLVTITKTGSATATQGTGTGVFATGTTTASDVKGVSFQTITYSAHFELFAAMTASFTAGVASTYQRLGLYNTTDGISVGYNGTTFGLWIRYNSVDTFIAQSAWNVDTCMSGAQSKFQSGGIPVTLDPTKINLYRIRFGWLGIAPIILELLSPDGNVVIAHIQQYANTSTTVNVTNPNLPLTIDVNNQATTSALTVTCGCWVAGTTSPGPGPTPGQSQSNSYPAPNSYAGPQVPINIDPFGNLEVRGAVTTDEQGFRDHFVGSSLTTTLTGTLTFANGSTGVAGVGTSFLTQVQQGQYVKLSSDSETTYAQVATLISNTQLLLYTPYTGSSTTAAAVVNNWSTTTGSGGSFTVSTSNVNIVNGLGNGTTTYLYRSFDYSPIQVTGYLSFTGGVTNQTAFFGFQGNPASPQQQAILQFDGALPTNQCRFITSSASGANETQTTVVTLPSGLLVTQELEYKITLTMQGAALEIALPNTFSTTVSAYSEQHIPLPYTVMEVVGGLANQAAVGSSATLAIDTVLIINMDRLEVANSFTSEPVRVSLAGKNPATNLQQDVVITTEGAAGTALMMNEAVVHSNATVTTTGSQIISKNFYGTQQVSLVVNVKASPTGTTPTIQYSIQEVDPGDGATLMGASASTVVINAIGVYIVTLATTTSGLFKVSWTVTGTTPSFTQVYSTVVSKATPQTQAVSTSPANATPGISPGYVVTTSKNNVPLRATTYTEQAANFTGSIVSSSAADTSAGTGARTVTIFYVDVTGATAGTETATLNGTTAVNLVTTTKCFIEKIMVATVGSGGANAGTITLFTGTGGTGTNVASIVIGDNRTQYAHHYVVTGKTCNITGMTGTTNSTNETLFSVQAVSIPVANLPSSQITDWVTGSQTNQTQRTFSSIVKVAGPARIVLFGAPGATASIQNYGSFDFYDQ